MQGQGTTSASRAIHELDPGHRLSSECVAQVVHDCISRTDGCSDADCVWALVTAPLTPGGVGLNQNPTCARRLAEERDSLCRFPSSAKARARTHPPGPRRDPPMRRRLHSRRLARMDCGIASPIAGQAPSPISFAPFACGSRLRSDIGQRAGACATGHAGASMAPTSCCGTTRGAVGMAARMAASRRILLPV